MPCDEITKAIEWSKKSTAITNFPVLAYFSLHNGLKSNEPIGFAAGDQVWYAKGGVTAQDGKPHLRGELKEVYTNGNQGSMAKNSKLAVKVEIFPDGTVSMQRLLDGTPIGGVPPTTLKLTCVEDDLLTGLDGGQVITVGVARAPEQPVGPK